MQADVEHATESNSRFPSYSSGASFVRSSRELAPSGPDEMLTILSKIPFMPRRLAG